MRGGWFHKLLPPPPPRDIRERKGPEIFKSQKSFGARLENESAKKKETLVVNAKSETDREENCERQVVASRERETGVNHVSDGDGEEEGGHREPREMAGEVSRE